MTLFPPSHHNAPPGTSTAAAAKIAPDTPTLRRAVFAFLLFRGVDGATDEELCDALTMDGNTLRPRRWELVKAGDAVNSGRKRKTRAGVSATVWVVKGAECQPSTT